MTEPRHRDELTLGYREASALDERRPSDQVRDAVHAHARMLIAAAKQPDTSSEAPPAVAANQSRWKVSAMLASVMLAGLAGLLVLQFDRGTPEEKELVHGAPVPRVAPIPRPGLAQAPQSSPVPSAPPVAMEKDARSDSNVPAVLPEAVSAAAPKPAAAATPKADAPPAAPRARAAAESLAKAKPAPEPFPATQGAALTAPSAAPLPLPAGTKQSAPSATAVAPAALSTEARREAAAQEAEARPQATGRLALKAEGAAPMATAPAAPVRASPCPP